jgi:hypothetical protein
MAPKYKLTLFITPENSGSALFQLYKALEVLSYTDYELRMVDIFEEHRSGSNANINRTPVLVYHAPDRDVFLDQLSDPDSVRRALGLLNR